MGRVEVFESELATRSPFDGHGLLAFLRPRAIAGVEAATDDRYVRVVTLPHGPGVMELRPDGDRVAARFELSDPTDLDEGVRRARHLLDLDTDPEPVDALLAQDPYLAPLVRSTPGIRLPGQVDGFEVVVRAIVGQQISVGRARAVLGEIAARRGVAVDLPLARRYGLTHAFMTAETALRVEPEEYPMPRVRGRAIRRVAAALTVGELELRPGIDHEAAREALLAVSGIGPWTADYVLMRAAGHRDVLLDTDLVLRRVLDREGIDRARTDRWSPWRSYASMHLWRIA